MEHQNNFKQTGVGHLTKEATARMKAEYILNGYSAAVLAKSYGVSEKAAQNRIYQWRRERIEYEKNGKLPSGIAIDLSTRSIFNLADQNETARLWLMERIRALFNEAVTNESQMKDLGVTLETLIRKLMEDVKERGAITIVNGVAIEQLERLQRIRSNIFEMQRTILGIPSPGSLGTRATAPRPNGGDQAARIPAEPGGPSRYKSLPHTEDFASGDWRKTLDLGEDGSVQPDQPGQKFHVERPPMPEPTITPSKKT